MSDTHSTTRPAYVYFVLFGESGPIKIGRTTKPLAQRLHGLQTGSPEPLRLLGFMAETSGVSERLLHDRFKHLRYRGEWFEPGPDLLAYIERNAERPSGFDVHPDHIRRIPSTGYQVSEPDRAEPVEAIDDLTSSEVTGMRWADWYVKWDEGHGQTMDVIARMYGVTESAVSKGIAFIRGMKRIYDLGRELRRIEREDS